MPVSPAATPQNTVMVQHAILESGTPESDSLQGPFPSLGNLPILPDPWFLHLLLLAQPSFTYCEDYRSSCLKKKCSACVLMVAISPLVVTLLRYDFSTSSDPDPGRRLLEKETL